MRTRVAIAVVWMLSCGAALADERYSGFLTFGCGDGYITVPAASETWYVDMSPARQQQVLGLANVDLSFNTWRTLYVELEGRIENKPRHGFFGDHARELVVTRFLAARFPEGGESIQVATGPAKTYRGYVLLGDESATFSPLERGYEIWWMFEGKVGWDEVNRQVPPSSEQLTGALVEIVGRVGPPGAYGHLEAYEREIAMDEFKVLRLLSPHELRDVLPTTGLRRKAEIEECKPQPR